MQRREFLALLGTPAYAELARRIGLQTAPDSPKADVTLRISSVEIEVAPRRIIKTTGYNGSAPGPVLRLREGQPVTVEVLNDTKISEIIHWHGLFVPSEADGSEEEGTPPVPPGGMRRYSFVPHPSGTRWYHSHVRAQRDMKRAMYTGQFGFLYIEPKEEPDQYDAEVLLALHNSHALGSGEPVRVKEGQRVLFRILNASATEQHRIALPGHRFKIVSLDGNAVPVPREVDTIEMGPAERVDSVVMMNQPGVWILGEANDQIRNAGLGIVVEYANRSELPQWTGRKLHGTTRFLDTMRRLPNRRAASCRSTSVRNLPGTTGWITGPLTVNPSRRPIPFESVPATGTAFASITKVMKRTQFTCTGTASN
jgi:FtsP/CotA-like multicopper oxidase with cupredoxin domain